MYFNKELCAKCGGKCCKTIPGVCHPQDFGLPSDLGEFKLKESLTSGRYCIDWWEGDVRKLPYGHPDYRGQCYYIRPACKGKEGQLTDPTWNGGMCTFWELDKGCTLADLDRPTECRMLEPGDHDKGDRCQGHTDGKREAATLWLPYSQLIDKLIKELKERS